MAKATVTKAEPVITLTMNHKEARTLRDILGHVSMTGAVKDLIEAMNGAGYYFRTTKGWMEGGLVINGKVPE